jgi:glucose dehydrogenase
MAAASCAIAEPLGSDAAFTTESLVCAGHDYANMRFSPLKQVSPGKTSASFNWPIRCRWPRCVLTNRLWVVTGDTLYVSTSWGPKYVYAIIAETGKPIESESFHGSPGSAMADTSA